MSRKGTRFKYKDVKTFEPEMVIGLSDRGFEKRRMTMD